MLYASRTGGLTELLQCSFFLYSFTAMSSFFLLVGGFFTFSEVRVGWIQKGFKQKEEENKRGELVELITGSR